MRRWADNYAKLSPACRARLTGAGAAICGDATVHGAAQLRACCTCWWQLHQACLSVQLRSMHQPLHLPV